MERKWWTLLAVCIGTFMLLLDITIVNTALPAIERSLDASFADLQWVLSGYALALAVFLLTAGSLADRFGRRKLFLAGLAMFSAASALCALAPTAGMLIAARLVQGLGAAVVFPASLAILAEAFQGPARRRAIGAWGATISVPAVGARAHRAEAALNIASPARNSRRRPKRSARLPAVSRNTASASA